MRIENAVVVITGGGSGIGAALARRFSADRAATVVVADLDEAAACAVADEVGGVGRACDVTSEAEIARLVDRTLNDHGRVDLFCSNAGLATGLGIEAPDSTWQLAFDIHVMAHVYAARAVLPAMLERGTGYLLNTASAAGLLTAPGDAPYTVSKHAAVAFAEWLALTYGGRGIGVSVLCPMGVATPLLERPLAEGDPSARAVAKLGEVVAPEQVADAVAAGLAQNRFLILPHPQVGTFWAQKASDPDRWLRGMRRRLGQP
ncbi:MAG: SDR family NAD(P)-dependent oxidoreductase [Actinomycetota bacterium]